MTPGRRAHSDGPVVRNMSRFTLPYIVLLASLHLAAPAPAASQAIGHDREIEGVVRDAGTGAPLAGVEVSVVGSSRRALTHGDGTFHLLGILPGEWTLRFERLGYRPVTREIAVTGTTPFLEIGMVPTPLDMAGLVVTGSISEREAGASARPVDVLSGEELQRRLQGTVAATLSAKPGVTAVTMGPATARPVVRGLGGDRVLLLEDGARVGDVSSSGTDHATALDPSSARRIEVVRGPASVLYGSSALGGVINVIRDEVPTDIPHHLTGSVTLQGRTVNDGWTGSAQARLPLSQRIPLRIEMSGRSAGDLTTPAGPLVNTGARGASASIGSGWVGDRGHVGAAFRAYRNDYGIPGGFVGGHAQGVNIEMRRTSTKLQGVWRPGAGPFSAIDLDGTHTWYQHKEIEPPNILGTLFKVQTFSGDLLARHDGWGAFSSGAVGVRASREAFRYGGALYTPDTNRLSVAAFTFQEMDLDPFRVEFGLRYDWIRADPLQDDPTSDIGIVRDRDFAAASGSLGVVYQPARGLTLGASAARAFRTPDVNELYSEGPHLAAYAFEVGNPSLGTEVGFGLDGFVRYAGDRVTAELTGFRNAISGFIYPRETGDTSRVGLPVYQFRGEDALLTGWEAALEWALVGDLKLEGTAAYVRGTLTGSDEPLPLIPPLQGQVGIALEPTDWFVRTDLRLAGAQERLGAFETATDGYATADLAAGLRLTLGGRLHVFTATLENLTDQEYRNHLSRVKAIMPEAGRGFSLTYRVVF